MNDPRTEAPQDNPDWDAGFIEGYKQGRAEAEAAPLTADHNHDGGAHCFSDCPAYTWQVRNSHGEMVTMGAAPRHQPVKRIRNRQAVERCIVDNEFWPCRAVTYGAAPRAEGLGRERERIAIELNHYDLSDDPGYIKVPTERVRAILSRPSDEKGTARPVCSRFRHDEHCAHLHES